MAHTGADDAALLFAHDAPERGASNVTTSPVRFGTSLIEA